MIIKSFVARNANEALRRVRKEMGGDAIVLKTRQLVDGVDGQRVEVTACLERPSVGQTSDILTRTGGAPSSAPASRIPDEAVAKVEEVLSRAEESAIPEIRDNLNLHRLEQKIDRLLARPHWNVTIDTAALVAAMTDSDAPNEIIDEFLQRCDDQDADSAVETLSSLIGPMICDDLSIAENDRVVVVGQAGVGKSSLIGKFAARFVAREKKTVTLATLDEQRIGAYDELQSYAAILGTEISAPNESKHVKKGVCLIDTPALTRDGKKNSELKAAVADLNPTHCFAVMSATQRSVDIRDNVKSFGMVGATHIVATMLDLTTRWGSILTACRTSGLKLAFVSRGPGGIGTLEKPTARTIAESLLKREANRERA